jgi:hypothetical protein
MERTEVKAPVNIVEKNIMLTNEAMQYFYKNFTIMENLPDNFRLVLLPDDDAELREYNIKILTQYIYDDVPVVFVRMHLASGQHLHYYQHYNIYAPLATA